MELLGTWWMWGGFAAIVILLLLVDLLNDTLIASIFARFMRERARFLLIF